MDDLSGLNWNAKSNQSAARPNYNSSAFATLKPTPPVSGRASPLNGPPSQPPSKPATPANDSFSNLVSFSNTGANKNLSLQEQQKRLADLKLQKQRKGQDHFSGVDDEIWNNLGSGTSTPTFSPNDQRKSPNGVSRPSQVVGNDVFASLNAGRFKKPPSSTSHITTSTSTATSHLEDDDPFGMAEFAARQTSKSSRQPEITVNNDDDDLLGLLGQPVSKKPKSPTPPRQASSPPQNTSDHPQDKAVAELVDMGFPIDKARTALERTETGIDVQAAVGWLLNQAHAEARQKAQARDVPRNGALREREDDDFPRQRETQRQEYRPSRPRQHVEDGEETPAWRSDRADSGTRGQKEPAQMAAELGSAFLKSAGSFWKQSQKRVQQAVQDFNNSDSDSGQPKWMREGTSPDASTQTQSKWSTDNRVMQREAEKQRSRPPPEVTDEAMLLESGRPVPPSRQVARPGRDARLRPDVDSSREHSPALPSRLRETHQPESRFSPPPQQQIQSSASSRAALNRQAIEDQASQAYVSSARRRKVTSPVNQADPQSDLLEGATSSRLPPRPVAKPPTQGPLQSQPPSMSDRLPQRKTATPVQAPSRPPPPARTIPPVSAMSLKASRSAREKGNESFKRGDYSTAHQAYTTSLSHLPPTHPITIVLLTNHALTALKIGEPKTAISDSDKAISIIGISKGESETVDFNNGEPPKPMRDYYGKALMRKAEALEQMEKWTEAGSVWREAVEGGHGGATSIQGRARCEKAANPQVNKPKTTPARKPAAMSRPRPGSTVASSGSANSEAVQRLRQANAAAEKADDEKFRLADSVQNRITAWKGGKADNLRALLASLDTVLWPEANWKKISMADLVLPGKVKVQYMKGIAKVHPDKIPTTATTEQRMIAGSVFSALNEAWDKFKAENNL